MAITSRRNTLLREHFTRTGKPKRKFRTEEEARQFNIRQKSSLQAYECYCGAWHLGGTRR